MRCCQLLGKEPYERVKVDVDENDPIISGIGEIINNAKPGDITENCGTKTTTTLTFTRRRYATSTT